MLLRLIKIFLCGLLILGLVGCGEESTITPFVDPVEAQSDFLKEPLTVPIPEIEVENPVNIFSALPIPIVGVLIDEIANVFANVFSTLSGGKIPVSTEEEVAIFEVGEVDKDIIRGLTVVKIELYYEPLVRPVWDKVFFWNKANLSFFEEIVIKIATQEQLDRNPNFRGIPIAFHDPKNPRWCDEKKRCLTMQIPAVNLIDYLDKPTKVFVIPDINVGRTPNNFILSGKIEFSLDTRLGF